MPDCALRRTSLVIASFATVLGCCASAGAAAADSVTIDWMSGYPLPGVSSEKITMEILRIPAGYGPKDRAIDQYFDAVQLVLTQCGITENWQYLPPDSSFVRLKIALAGRSIELTTDRFALRPEGSRDLTTPICDAPGQNRNDRNRAALDKILELSMERTRTRFGK